MNNKDHILWGRLPDKKLNCNPHQKRVLQFDPSNVPSMFSISPFSRYQNVSMTQLFPSKGNMCSCGCGLELKGRRTRWATKDCEWYAVAVRFIIYGATDTISSYMRLYYGWNCSNCGCEDKGHDMGSNGVVAWIKIDHIIPVKLGGGACWLSNYQLLCHDCHVNKTNTDFKWNGKKTSSLPSLFNNGQGAQERDARKVEQSDNVGSKTI